jgi:hypothetical protein
MIVKQKTMKRKSGKRTIIFLPVIFLSTLSFMFFLSSRDYTHYFHLRHGSLAEIVERRDSAVMKSWITLRNSDGFKVECGLLNPKDSSKRYPAVILLGGKATGKFAIDYALDIDNVIILALDYPYEPRDSYTFWTILWDVPAVRKALIDMVPATMLATDYLFRRTDVDTAKLVILGYSFGAPFVPPIVALDRRATVAAMVYGGGDLTSMIRHNVARYESMWMSEFVGRLGGLLLHPLEPMRYADKISPTPLIMINGLNDEQVPRYNTELFFNAAREPKKLIWLDSKHVNPRNPELTRRIIAELKEELRRLKIL